MVKNCDLSLENAAEAVGRGQYFEDLGHSFSPYGPPSRQITYMYGNFTKRNISVMFCFLGEIDGRAS